MIVVIAPRQFLMLTSAHKDCWIRGWEFESATSRKLVLSQNLVTDRQDFCRRWRARSSAVSHLFIAMAIDGIHNIRICKLEANQQHCNSIKKQSGQSDIIYGENEKKAYRKTWWSHFKKRNSWVWLYGSWSKGWRTMGNQKITGERHQSSKNLERHFQLFVSCYQQWGIICEAASNDRIYTVRYVLDVNLPMGTKLLFN